MDSSYKIKISGKQVLLQVHPTEEGRKASLSDIQKDLRRRNIQYRHETLFDIFRRASDEFEPLAIHEMRHYQVSVEVSEDRQQAWLTVVAPETGEDQLNPNMIKEALEGSRVEKGILYDVIKKVLASGEGVDRVLVAKGKPHRHGVDGKIEFTEKPMQHFVLGDNTADYRELGLINNVEKDDLVATITLPTWGEEGYDIHARTLRARPGKKAKLKLGRNVKLSEEGTELFATRSGYVVRIGSKISVENVLEVNNVDSETGNIRFHGVVKVRGQVEDGFAIDADKGIEVSGTVGKATLSSRGDIKVGGGALGATLECEGNVAARFLSDCTVKVGQAVTVEEYILHSEVVAKRSVKVVHEKKGFIQGGRIRSGTEIWAATVGSGMSEERTVLEVGGGVNVRKRFDLLDERMEAQLESYEKIRKNLLYLEKQRETTGQPEGRELEIYRNTLENGEKMTSELLAQAQTHHDLLQQLADPQEEGGMVMIANTAHPGTSIQVQTSRVNLRDPMEGCAFAIMTGGLKAMPFSTALKLHKQQRAKKATR